MIFHYIPLERVIYFFYKTKKQKKTKKEMEFSLLTLFKIQKIKNLSVSLIFFQFLILIIKSRRR